MSDKSFKVDTSIVLRPSDAPANPENGEMYYDKSVGRFKKYENGAWQDLSGNSILPTGIELDYHGTTPPAGFVFASGKTIGSDASGATERANNDTFALYSQLWSAYSNTILPIQDMTGTPTTRGASAADDFLANKRLPTPDKRGRVSVGLDNMGGTAANRMTAGGSGINGTVMGANGGSQTHTLTEAQMPLHNHFMFNSLSGGGIISGAVQVSRQQNGLSGNNYTMTTTSGTIENGITSTRGSGTAHNNTQPSWINTKIISL